jgi:predicted DNA-binding protein YlxM (UPF0122 family)
MVIAKLSGGLGNQLFQYAFARGIQLKHKTQLKTDLSWYDEERNNHEFYQLNSFPNINIHKASARQIFFYKRKTLLSSSLLYKAVSNLFNYKTITETQFNFNPKQNLSTSKNCYTNGYWQSEKYFNKIRETLLNDFSFPELSTKNNITKQNICNTNSCSLHIRRGDYVTNPLNKKNHGALNLMYYQNALNRIQQKVNNLSLFVFSDDIEWVKENLSTNLPTIYVDWNIGKSAIHDMHLMSLCKHNIIANSSFSWWAAWLNNNPSKMVFAPKKWFNERDWDTTDLIPKNWIKI